MRVARVGVPFEVIQNEERKKSEASREYARAGMTFRDRWTRRSGRARDKPGKGTIFAQGVGG